MRALVFTTTFAASLALAPSVAAQEADNSAWVRVSPPSGEFSVMTPCDEGGLESLDREFSFVDDPERAVSCDADGVMFLAAVIRATGERGWPTFDQLRELRDDEALRDGVVHTETVIQGRRALISHGDGAEGNVKVGFIELSADSILFVMAGATSFFDAVPLDVGSQIDRFYESLEIAS